MTLFPLYSCALGRMCVPQSGLLSLMTSLVKVGTQHPSPPPSRVFINGSLGIECTDMYIEHVYESVRYLKRWFSDPHCKGFFDKVASEGLFYTSSNTVEI